MKSRRLMCVPSVEDRTLPHSPGEAAFCIVDTGAPGRQWIHAEVLTPWDTGQSLKTTRLASLEMVQIQVREEIARL
jgi:hypothetical protein